MLVNDWGGGQQLEDDGKEEVLSPLEEIITVNYKEKDETLIESQKSDIKTEMETGNPVFDNNDSGKGEIPSTLDEGKTGNVKRKRIRCIKRGICTLEGTLDFLF